MPRDRRRGGRGGGRRVPTSRAADPSTTRSLTTRSGASYSIPSSTTGTTSTTTSTMASATIQDLVRREIQLALAAANVQTPAPANTTGVQPPQTVAQTVTTSNPQLGELSMVVYSC